MFACLAWSLSLVSWTLSRPLYILVLPIAYLRKGIVYNDGDNWPHEWLLPSWRGFELHTDHNNMFNLFDLTKMNTYVFWTAAWNVLRYAFLLRAYKCTLRHVLDTYNVWADPTSYYFAFCWPTCFVSVSPVPFSSPPDFRWSDINVLSNSTPNYNIVLAEVMWPVSDGFFFQGHGTIWILDYDADFQLIIVISRIQILENRVPEQQQQRLFGNSLRGSYYVWYWNLRHLLCLPSFDTWRGQIASLHGPAIDGHETKYFFQFDHFAITNALFGSCCVLTLQWTYSHCFLPLGDIYRTPTLL